MTFRDLLFMLLGSFCAGVMEALVEWWKSQPR